MTQSTVARQMPPTLGISSNHMALKALIRSVQMFRRAPIVSPMNSVLRAIVPVVPSASRSTIALAQSTSVLNYICILHCLFRQYIPKHLLRFILYILLYSLHHSDKNRHLFISLHGTFIKLLFIFDSRSQLVSHQRG